MTGVILRIVVLRSAAGRLDGDEGVVAMMADAMRQGHTPPLFFSGQYYGGTYEPMLGALALLVHRSAMALKMVPLLCSAIGGVVLARTGRRFTSEHQARFVGAVFFAWPGTTWLATKERGFYWVMLIFVVTALLFAARLHHREPHRLASWFAFGAAVGGAWYTSVQSVYLLAPLTIWLLITARPRLNEVARATIGFLAGAAPWIVGFVKYGSKVLHQEPASAAYFVRLNHVTFQLVPRVLGLRRLFVGGWTLGLLGTALYGAAIGAIVWWLYQTVASWRTNQRSAPHAMLLGALILAFPILAAVPSLATFVSEPRYGLLLVPPVALIVGRFARTPLRAFVSSALIVTFAIISTANLVDLANQPQQALLDLAPSRTEALTTLLQQRHIDRVYADYWLAYPLTFASKLGLVASPVDLPRNRETQSIVDSAQARTWVVYAGSSRDFALQRLFAHGFIRAVREPHGEFAVFTLTAYLNPINLNRFWVRYPPGK